MSATSIHYEDGGYTASDFLYNVFDISIQLFRKPLFSYMLTGSSYQSQHDLTSKEILPASSYKCMKDIVNNSMNHELKLLRTNSLIDNDRISTNKFKIFFKTIMHNEHDEGYLNNMWTYLESSMQNPFEFDRFIEKIRYDKVKKAYLDLTNESTNPSQISFEVILPIRSKTPEQNLSQKMFGERRWHKSPYIVNKLRPVEKYTCQYLKKKLRNEVQGLKSVLLRNQKLLRQK